MSNRMPDSTEVTSNRNNVFIEPQYVERNDFEFRGLRPNTKHDLYMNGQLYNFAAKPYGKNLGDPIITDALGSVKFFVLTEGVYQLPITEEDKTGALFDSSTKNLQRDKREKIVFRTFNDFQLISADQKSSATVRKYTDSLVNK